MKCFKCEKGSTENLLAVLAFAVILIGWYLIAVESSEQAVDRSVKEIDEKLNFSKYQGGNSTEFGLAKIEKGNMLIEKGEKEISSTVMGRERAYALIDKGKKELSEGVSMLNGINKNNNT